MSTAIILTSTVNINSNLTCLFQKNQNERINTYVKSVLQWLNNTNFNIILVENSGYNFGELENEKKIFSDRFEVITFNDDDFKTSEYYTIPHIFVAKGSHETFAINYAYTHSKLIKSKVPEFIIKITARFFIPGLQEYLSLFNLNKFDCLTQNDIDRCEMVGCHRKHFSHMFNNHLLINNTFSGHVEAVYKYRTSFYKKILRCVVFPIEETQRGGEPQRLLPYKNISIFF
jgi:hypothetical protein